MAAIRKVQVIVSNTGQVVDVSRAYPGAVHDKTVWNREIRRVHVRLTRPVLADKAYAGAVGEGDILFRPAKRNETAHREHRDSAKAANRMLSRIRVKIENVFAQMKAFRILQGLFSLKPERYAMVFRAVAVIHNENLQDRQKGH